MSWRLGSPSQIIGNSRSGELLMEVLSLSCSRMWCINNRSLTVHLNEGLEQGLEAGCVETR